MGLDNANLDSVTIYNLLPYGSYKSTLLANLINITAAIAYITKTNMLTPSKKTISRIHFNILAALAVYP